MLCSSRIRNEEEVKKNAGNAKFLHFIPSNIPWID